MDSQYDGSYTSLLMSDDLFDESGQPNPNDLLENPNEVIPGSKKSQRTKNFSREEDVLLVSAWINTSKDAITGSEQQSSSFWRRIHDYFSSNGGANVERSQASLKNRWCDINSKCAKFVGYVSQIDARTSSGKTNQNRLTEARELFAALMGKQFQYEHCWEILQFEQKWTNTMSLSMKKQKSHSNASPASSSPATPQSVYLGDSNEASPNMNRPLGRKASKRQLKNKNSKDDVEESVTDKRWQEKVDLERAKAERHQRALEQHQIQLEQQQTQLAHQQRQIAIDEQRMEMQVMQTDTSGMDQISADYWNKLKMEIIARRGFNL